MLLQLLLDCYSINDKYCQINQSKSGLIGSLKFGPAVETDLVLLSSILQSVDCKAADTSRRYKLHQGRRFTYL